ncbi:MAG: hypothetical protein FWD49_05150 [Firmicutes bacterium]|nr:hypothetical protein [Bacillota bacterium]
MAILCLGKVSGSLYLLHWLICLDKASGVVKLIRTHPVVAVVHIVPVRIHLAVVVHIGSVGRGIGTAECFSTVTHIYKHSLKTF